MRYTLLLSLMLSSCSTLLLRKETSPPLKVVVVVSYDGKGLSAVPHDSASRNIRISIMNSQKKDFKFVRSVYFGSYDSSSGSYIANENLFDILETKMDHRLSDMKVKIQSMVMDLKIPDSVKIVSPRGDLHDWDTITFEWEGKAPHYILRIYAFTTMGIKDEIITLNGTSYTLDLSELYGNGFLSVSVCPLSGSNPKKDEKVRVFALGECDIKTFLVGDTTVWGGYRPEAPWKRDDLLWYLLMI